MRRNDKNKKETVTLNFIKVHAPFEILCQYAEKLNYAMPYDVSLLLYNLYLILC